MMSPEEREIEALQRELDNVAEAQDAERAKRLEIEDRLREADGLLEATLRYLEEEYQEADDSARALERDIKVYFGRVG